MDDGKGLMQPGIQVVLTLSEDAFSISPRLACGERLEGTQPAASSSMIGPNTSQRSPLNRIICNC
jgi:hypothetical protein